MNPVWTVSSVASLCGVTRQAAESWLRKVAPDGSALRPGGEVRLYSFHSLPAIVQEKLQRLAGQRHYADVDLMATHFTDGWKAPLPLNQVARVFRDKAERLRDIGAPLLMQRGQIPWPQLVTTFSERLGISEKQAGRILDRADWRDGRLNQWQRLELWIDDKAFSNPPQRPAAVATRSAFNHTALEMEIARLENKSSPTLADRQYLFHRAFLHLEEIQQGLNTAERRDAKNSLLAYLHSVLPGLTPAATAPLAALRRNLERKYKQWLANGRAVEALADKRPARSGTPQYICAPCDKMIYDQSLHLRDNVTLAYRLLRKQGRLCAACMDRYRLNLRLNKSYMAKSLRERTTPDALVRATFSSPRKAKADAGHRQRDWSDLNPGDYFVADDETPNHVVYDYVDGVLQVGRVQALVMEDLRTGYPLDAFIYFGPPNGHAIWRLCRAVYMGRIGLPRFGNYFEFGAFASRLLEGKQRGRNTLHLRERQSGLEKYIKLHGAPFDSEQLGLRARGLDLEMRHATSAKAKTIEQHFNIRQHRAAMLPGYVGFNERLENRERTQNFIAKVKSGKADPTDGLLSLSEFVQNYKAILEEFAHEPQNGDRLRGASPFEMWRDHVGRHPLRKLPRDMEYLLSSHDHVVTVRPHGIVIPLGRYEQAIYYSEDTGRFIGKKVKAYYHINCPEILTFMDPKKPEQRFTVERVLQRSMTATPEDFAKTQKQISGHAAASKGIIANLSHPLSNTIIRDNDYPKEAKDFGAYVNAETERANEQTSARSRQVRKIQNDALAMGGASVNAQIRNPERVQEGIDWENELRARLKKQSTESKDSTTP